MTKLKLAVPLAALSVTLVLSQFDAFGNRSGPVRISTPTVSAKDDFFSPKAKQVSTGGSVKWNWRGDNDHNVTFRKVPRGASKHGSGDRSKGDRPFQRSFSKAGSYRYVCTIHEDEGMRGTVKAG
ncbi:MAG: plastocyanin/azurin family copper-binding protein [Solirubrobacterales bacterium]